MEESNGIETKILLREEEPEISAKSEDKSMYEECFQRGIAHCERKEKDKALTQFSQCLGFASKIKDKELEFKANEGMGYAYRVAERFEEAMKHYEKCLTIASDIKKSNLQREAHLMLGIVYRLKGDYCKAIEENVKSLKMNEREADEFLQAQALLAMGIVYRLQKDFPRAWDYYEKCFAIASKINDKDILCQVHVGLGMIYKSQQKYTEAIEELKKGYLLAKEAGKQDSERSACIELGFLHSLNNEHTHAMNYFKKSGAVYDMGAHGKKNKKFLLSFGELGRHHKTLNQNVSCPFLETVNNLENVEGIYLDIGGSKLEECAKMEQESNKIPKRAAMNMFLVSEIETRVLKRRRVNAEDTDEKMNSREHEIRQPENPDLWKWNCKSEKHRGKFKKLLERAKKQPKDVSQINGVCVWFHKDCRIGMGSNGTEVFVGLGHDGTEKAVKRMLKSYYETLAETEKKILQERNTVESKYTVKYWFLDHKSSPDFVYLFLTLCEETLEEFVTEFGTNETRVAHKLKEEAPNIIRDVLRGLADLHQGPKSIIHRDLKPTNILRNIDGRWLLADFGISRTLEEEKTTRKTGSAGTDFWRAAETYPADDMPENSKVRYKKQSDIQVAGMVAYYVVTKGKHPFGERSNRIKNLLNGKPVGLDTLEDYVLKDLLSWMLSHKPKDRPYAAQALKHPYLQHDEDQFQLLHKMGNEPEIKDKIATAIVVKELNRGSTDWRQKMSKDVYDSLRTNGKKGNLVYYGGEWTECLRFIRNCQQHWDDITLPRPKELPDEPHEFFLKLFPSLPVKVHKIVRNCEWKDRRGLKKFFDSDTKSPSTKLGSVSEACPEAMEEDPGTASTKLFSMSEACPDAMEEDPEKDKT